MMKKLLLILLAFVHFNLVQAQVSSGGEPVSKNLMLNKNIPTITLEAVSEEWKANAALEDGKKGGLERIAKNISTNFSLKNSGSWEYLFNGDRVWRLNIKAQDAQGINPLFKNFYLPEGSKLFIYTPNYKKVLGAFTAENNHESKDFSSEVLFGDEMIIEYIEPSNKLNEGSFTIESVGSFFKDVGVGAGVDLGFGDSDPCQINVNCAPVGNSWQDEKRGVARILVVTPTGQGWCTGSLVNNGSYDCKNYFLTALHCGDDNNINFNQWVFYFNYEFSGCNNGSSASVPSNSTTGATFRSQSRDLTTNGNNSSDFLLLELNNALPASYNVYYNGWNTTSSAPSGGVGIHHPAGDVKKISTFGNSSFSVGVSWGPGNGYSTQAGTTHWSLEWTSNSNGHGVTEGGSSGSPIFNDNGEIVGTLSGGGSFCSALTSDDQYGKMSYHWESNGTTNNRQLSPWLDPNNANLSSLTGSNAPCAPISPNDAGITVVLNPTGTFCTSSIIPEVTLRNFGTVNLNSVDIKYRINGGVINTFNWTGNLAQNASINVTLPAITAPVGNNNLEAYTENPNAGTDSNSNNDSSDEDFTVNSTINLPLNEDFEANAFPPVGFSIGNGDNDITWEQDASVGFGTGTKSMFIDNWNYNAPNQLDWLVTETFDFSAVTNATLTYDFAYAYYDQTNGNNVGYDTLGIAASTNCGESFFWLWKEGGTQIATAGGLGIEFVPTNADWTNKTLDLSSLSNETSVQFAFIAKNGYGNNMYIDNINITNIVIPTPPVADFSVNDNNICINNSVNFSDLSTNSPSSWNWSFPGGTPSNSTAQNPTITYNTAGTYAVILTAINADGSDAEVKNAFIIVNNNPSLIITPISTNCFGLNDGSIIANASGAGGFLYSLNGSSASTSNVFNNLAANNYTIAVTDINGCSTSASSSVIQPSELSLGNSITPATCTNNNGVITPQASGGTPPYVYNFSNGGNGQNLLPGNYTIIATDANNCSLSQSVVVPNINSNLSFNNIIISAICNNNNGSITPQAVGGTLPYTFSFGNGGNGQNLIPGSYSLSVTDANGCTLTENAIVPNTNSNLNISTTIVSAFCNSNNGSISAQASGGTAPYTITFGNGGNGQNLTPGNYNITASDANGCTLSENITVPNINQTFSINVITTQTSCTGNDGTASASVNGITSGYTFLWDNGQMTSSASNLSFGQHTVTVTNQNGCSETTTFNITNANAPNVNLTSTNLDCFEDENGTASINISGGTPGYSIVWSSSNNSTTTESNLSAGTYFVIVTDAANCSTQEFFTITEPSPIEVSFMNEDEHCDSNDGLLLASATGGTPGYSFIWSNGTSGNLILNQAAGNYTITVSDANNCIVEVASSIINIPAAAISNIVVTDVKCADEKNGSILLDVSGGTGNISTLWSNGAVTEDLNNISGGNYTITITDDENCVTDSTITVIEADPISISLNVVDNSPNTNSSITANAFGGSQIYNFSWNTGSSAQTITNLPIGTYTITVSDSENCLADTTVNIGNPETIGVFDEEIIQNIFLYPNPIIDELNVVIELEEALEINLNVMNSIGQQLISKPLKANRNISEKINMKDFAKGIYYLEIETEKGTSVHKFIKMN